MVPTKYPYLFCTLKVDQKGRYTFYRRFVHPAFPILHTTLISSKRFTELTEKTCEEAIAKYYPELLI